MTLAASPIEPTAKTRAGVPGRLRLSLRGRLVALVVAAVLPLLLFSVAVVYRLGQVEGGAVEASLRQSARAMSLAVDREIGAAHAVLGVLAQSPALKEGDLAAFHREASIAAGVRDAAIVLVDRTGLQLVNTMRPFEPGGPRLQARIPGLIESVFASGAPQVSDVFPGALSGEPRVAAAAPVKDAGGEVTHLLGMLVPSARLSALVAEQGLAPSWIGAVFDRGGLIVARTRDPDRYVGRPGGASLRERILAGAADGFIENVTADGQEVYSVFARSPITGWTVSIGMPRAEADGRIAEALRAVAAVGTVLLLAAILLATLVGQGIARPVAALAGAARAIGHGTPLPERPPASIPELAAVERSLWAAQATIARREAELRAATARAEQLAAERAAVLDDLAGVQRIGRVGGLEVDLRGGGFRNRRSPEYLRIHGLPPDHADESFESWAARVHPDDRDEVVARYLAAVRGAVRDYESEYRILRPSDGAERWILSRAEIERDGQGRPLHLLGAHIDITDRKRAELALEARTRELEIVLDTVPAGVWFTHDPEVREVRRNRYAAALMGDDRRFARALDGAPDGDLPHIRVVRDGWELTLDELPLERAVRGIGTVDEELVFLHGDGTERAVLASANPLRDERGRIAGAVAVIVDISERKRAERHQALLLHELNHRVKNTLATVQSIAAQTFKGDTTSGPARAAFEARLIALSRAHDVLTRESWEGAHLTEIVAGAVNPHRGPGDPRFLIDGPDLRVAPRMALALAMALHELCTNAAKYGALSVPGGRVRVAWSVTAEGAERRLLFRWEEQGGPPVAPPVRRGFGTRLIERQLATEFDGSVALRFPEGGVVCNIEARLRPEAGWGETLDLRAPPAGG